jgi:hypothetical protein
MKPLFLILTLVICFNGMSQGLRIDMEKINRFSTWLPVEQQGFATEDLPTKISYRIYTPKVQDQGNSMTCVGWAVAYAQLSTQQNLAMGITDTFQKIIRAMDPYYVYSYIRNPVDDWCYAGASMEDALSILTNKGTKPRIWDPLTFCYSNLSSFEFTNTLASHYSIKGYNLLDSGNLVQHVKLALGSKKIVSIGVNLTESIKLDNSSHYGIWLPSSTDSIIGKHAMCVVGYDDDKYGGAFEIMNSWGTEYGEGGFLWIKYEDFKKYVLLAYIMEIGEFNKGNCSMGDCSNSYSRYTFENGNIYEGLMLNGAPDEYGAMLYKNGDFYIGGYKQGRKHGYGIRFDAKQRRYFEVQFKNDIPLSSTEKQGYASDDKSNELSDLLDILNAVNPGKRIAPDSEEHYNYLLNLDVPSEPLVIRNKK